MLSEFWLMPQPTEIMRLATTALSRISTIAMTKKETDRSIFYRFYDDGKSAAIMKMTNFNPNQVGHLWRKLEPHLIDVYNIGSGRKISVSRKDVFL